MRNVESRRSKSLVRYLSLYKGKEDDRVNYTPGKRICVATRSTTLSSLRGKRVVAISFYQRSYAILPNFKSA